MCRVLDAATSPRHVSLVTVCSCLTVAERRSIIKVEEVEVC